MLEAAPALDRARLLQTVDAIAAVQRRDGAIPEFPGGITNPWNHVEAAMALDVGGLRSTAERAYSWLAATQRPDGAWAAGYLGAEVVDRTLDANFCAYVAFGVWHHFLITEDRGFLEETWSMVERAMGFVMEMQKPDGTIAWARDAKRRMARTSLLTSNSCIFMSLRSAIHMATELGQERTEWELSQAAIGGAIRQGDHLFASKRRFSMDWYYPVLARAVEGEAAALRIGERWDEFVVANRGARCVVDRPWVTAGETAELVLALHAMGRTTEANLLLGWIDHLRADDGAYWIGATFPDDTVWPQQKPTWGSGSVVLAADVLAGGVSAQVF